MIVTSKLFFFLSTILLLSNAFLFTSKEFKGFNVKDQIYQQIYPERLNAPTTCTSVNLNVAPYFYNGTVRTGYLNVNKGNSVIQFIFYGKQHATQAQLPNIPLIIWLNGGPGSSSQLGNLFECGPFRLVTSNTKPYDIVRNNDSWTKDYSVLFVDQPVGTGLSYADQGVNNVFCKNMSNVADDFYIAFKQLIHNTPGCLNQLKFKVDHKFVIFGESYAGKFAPAIAEKFLRQAQDNNGPFSGLKGVAIGDGFTHPTAILQQMGEYAYNLGLLDYQQRSTIQQMILNGTYQQRRRYWRDLHQTFQNVLDYIVQSSGGVNVYDITKYQRYPDIIIEEYLSSYDVQTLFGLRRDIKFNAQKSHVYEAMYEDFMQQQVHLVEQVLRRNCNVLVYNGQNDLIVETPGTFKWAQRVYYDKTQEFRNTLFSTWKVNNKVAGYFKKVGLYELKTVNNAGHLIPMDQGPAARVLMQDFMKRSLTQTKNQII